MISSSTLTICTRLQHPAETRTVRVDSIRPDTRYEPASRGVPGDDDQAVLAPAVDGRYLDVLDDEARSTQAEARRGTQSSNTRHHVG